MKRDQTCLAKFGPAYSQQTVSQIDIITGECESLTDPQTGEVRKCLETIATLLSDPAPPDLVLNRHCAKCKFQPRCRKLAIEKDDLSLLESLTAKVRRKLHLCWLNLELGLQFWIGVRVRIDLPNLFSQASPGCLIGLDDVLKTTPSGGRKSLALGHAWTGTPV
jgi:hypothetical protein